MIMNAAKHKAKLKDSLVRLLKNYHVAEWYPLSDGEERRYGDIIQELVDAGIVHKSSIEMHTAIVDKPMSSWHRDCVTAWVKRRSVTIIMLKLNED